MEEIYQKIVSNKTENLGECFIGFFLVNCFYVSERKFTSSFVEPEQAFLVAMIFHNFALLIFRPHSP